MGHVKSRHTKKLLCHQEHLSMDHLPQFSTPRRNQFE